MKKSVLFSCFTAFMVANAYGQVYNERLASVLPTVGSEADYYTYNEDNSFARRFHQDNSAGGYTYADSVTYNDLGQIAEEATYQDLKRNGELTLVNKCIYGYTEQGLLEWRDNYNSYGDDNLTQSAHITYEYDEQGHKVKENQYWVYDLENPFMIVEYHYDESGTLTDAKETMQDWWNPTKYEVTGLFEYAYDEQGRLTSETSSYVESGVAKVSSVQVYTYDENNDIICSEVQTASGSVNSRQEFEYDTTVEAAEVLLPSTHEYELPHTWGMTHKRTKELVWGMDDNSGQLVYAYDNIYNYEPAATTVGLRRVATPVLSAYFDAETKAMILTSAAQCSLRIVGANGQALVNTMAAGRVDLSSLTAGTYIATIRVSGQPATYHKFVVR